MEHENQQYCQLHYPAPATEWNQALPLGNGRLGCMAHGRPSTELLQLNEDSVWYGGPQNRTPRDAFKHLGTLRQLIREDKHAEAEALVRTAFFATPANMRHYEPLGSCYFEFNHEAQLTNYRRALDLTTAVHTVSYQHAGIAHERQTFASFPDNVILTRITSSQRIRFIIRLSRVGAREWDTTEFLDSINAAENHITLQATPGGHTSNRLCIALKVKVEDGSVEAIGNCLVIQGKSCVVAIGAHTTYRRSIPELSAMQDVDAALEKSWDELYFAHVKDYQALFGRTTLRLWPDESHLPTDYRLQHRRDPGLVALYHHYGRYLLISSSRDAPRALPANLQGIWNPSFSPPWGCKFTININIQMNYWPAGPSNLLECALPLIDLLERMVVNGKHTAKTMYGCNGWCAHSNTDIWADTDPADRWMPATLWPMGGAWLCISVIDTLKFNYDVSAHKRMQPILLGCIEFILDFLIPSADGAHLVTSPSVSPENTFISGLGTPGILCEGSTIDIMIIEALIDAYFWSLYRNSDLHSPEMLEKVSDVTNLMSKMPKVAVNQQGLIQEWGLKDYAEHEPGHRHVSHLFALYPGRQIDADHRPELLLASRNVLHRRAAHGGGHTGWSRAWLLNLHARLGDANGCVYHADQLLATSTLPNMLDNHPPFQIDGNFGGCAGVVECLVQSRHLHKLHMGKPKTVIDLLPACPDQWSTGSVSGIRVLGGGLLSFSWTDWKIQGTVVLSYTKEQAQVESTVGVWLRRSRKEYVWFEISPDGTTIRIEADTLND